MLHILGSTLSCGNGFRAALDRFSRSFDREALFVKKVLDLEDQLNILTAIESLIRAALLRRNFRKLRFPITQYVRLDSCKPADIADAEV